jgi:hypothetical protein
MRSLVDGLCSFAGRGACTDAERRSALWLHDELRGRRLEPFVETHWVRPQRWAVLAIGCLLCVAGSLLSVPLPVAGLAAAGLGALSLAVEALGWVGPVRLLFPRRATQHVLTAVPELGPTAVPELGPTAVPELGPTAGSDLGPTSGSRVPLVIAAAYDAPRRGLVLNERWRALLRRVPRATPAACGALVAAAAGARVAEVEGGWLGAVQLVPTIVLLVAFAAAVDVALSAWAPGANDNASGVAVALAVFRELEREPPRALAPALLLVGAGHAVPRSVRAHLRAEHVDGVLLELGPCGAGRPVLRARHPQARAAAARAGEALGAEPGGELPAAAGVRIACVDERGIVPRAHQENDTIVDEAAMEAALDLALGVVDALDAELLRPERTAAA